jgi:hypothetical protein
VKILAGQEMGFGPFASMTGVHIIQGRPAVGANLMAAAVKGSGRYDYRVKEMTDTVCEISFLQSGQEIGTSKFSVDDARKAGTKNMDKFPRNMLFARAMSNGVRWYCPDVFNGAAVYTPEELGANTDQDGNVIEGSYTTSQPTPNGNGNGHKAALADELFPAIPESLKRKFHAVGHKVYGDEWDDKRAELVSTITKGKSRSSNDLTREQMEKLVEGIEKKMSQQPQPLVTVDAPQVDAGYAE